ncbi:hypothetical protein BWD09_09825 [Neisseria dentiae]|uniref:DUF3322 and DUF2220 domain-containing protein n=1 Tax=Neisseria dentiae TaxID=194197 RepID=A0A1X3D4K5_9NEIS|nr:DUF3322 and DUF2220 domain-containing protein [Neisseria dentiae]OSI14726.1 hypothetical protein BWD09_09825 [Neisseria dentiae]QMT44284.1 hypothetical protein H3L92_07255 [Neisseria dentiae]
MRLPEDVRQWLDRRFHNKKREWLRDDTGEDQWPLEVPLGVPTEQAALKQIDGVRAWVSAWQSWQGIGTLSWCERRWKALGVQRLPEKLTLRNADEVSLWIGASTRWERAQSRYQTLTTRWPMLAQPLPKYFDILADYSEADFRRLADILDWIHCHPQSNLYPRQIPVAGIDSKWLESRKALIADLMATLQGEPTGERDFFRRCGLRAQPQLLRMRVLDPSLRARLGGLGDISAPCEEIAGLDIQPKQVFIVENLQTGLAFTDLPGTVVIMRLGYAVDVLGRLPWLQQAQCIYWGDLDTHGFAILHRARTYLPHLKTVLMDESTLMSHRDLWGEEKAPHPATELSLLTHSEQQLYQSIKENTLGQHIRLEQERIRWDVAWDVIKASIR